MSVFLRCRRVSKAWPIWGVHVTSRLTPHSHPLQVTLRWNKSQSTKDQLTNIPFSIIIIRWINCTYFCSRGCCYHPVLVLAATGASSEVTTLTEGSRSCQHVCVPQGSIRVTIPWDSVLCSNLQTLMTSSHLGNYNRTVKCWYGSTPVSCPSRGLQVNDLKTMSPSCKGVKIPPSKALIRCTVT